jgi:deoxyribonuclease-4
MSARFGPAGNSESFKAMGYKSSLDVPDYVVRMGLDAYEYQCGRGVNIGEEKARELGEKAAASGVALSLHAPYYISLSAAEESKLDNSINYILQSARAADWMGATRVIVHAGSKGKMERSDAVSLAVSTFKRALEALDANGLSHITLCPETMGKINQLGTLEEIMDFCRVDERVIPCIDFGHINARTHGGIRTADDYKKLFDIIENAVGIDRLRRYHAHFSKIEYSDGGEVRHLTFEDSLYGPEFEPLMELTAKKGCSPTIICESAGTQAEDALAMKMYYDSITK